MPVVAPAASSVPSELPPSTTAALMLCAANRLARLELPRPSVADVLRATGASRSRAYETKARLETCLAALVRPVGRPAAPISVHSGEAAVVELSRRMLDHVLAHPGCVSGPSARRHYADGLRFAVLGWLEEYDTLALETVADAIRIPLGTLKGWRREAAAGLSDADPTADEPAVEPPPPDGGASSRTQTLLAEWTRWRGTFSGFCDHVRTNCAIDWGRTQIATVLEALGVRLRKRRPGRSPDEDGLRDAFETFFPHAQWVGDGTQIRVELDGEPFVVNLELNVDARTGAFVGAEVSPTEDSDAVVAAFHDSRTSAGRRPIAILLDNKPSNHTAAVDATLDGTLRIRATPYRAQNKAHVEGGFGLLKPTLDGLTLSGDSPAELATSFVRALVITACRAINHRPRKDRDGRSRADLLKDTPTQEQVEQATRALEERLRRQELARRTRAARQDPVVRAEIADAYARLELDDPDDHLLTATARYPLEAVVEGIAIFTARRRAGTLPDGVDARYLLGIVRNVAEERELWELGLALWDERIRAGDRVAAALVRERRALSEGAPDPTEHVIAAVERALAEPGRIKRFFWLTTAADVVRTEPLCDRQRLFRTAARRVAAAHAVPPKQRAQAQRFLAAKLLPLL